MLGKRLRRTFRAMDLRKNRGIAIITVSALLFVFLGFGSLVFDIGYLHIVKGELQNAADALVEESFELDESSPRFAAIQRALADLESKAKEWSAKEQTAMTDLGAKASQQDGETLSKLSQELEDLEEAQGPGQPPVELPVPRRLRLEAVYDPPGVDLVHPVGRLERGEGPLDHPEAVVLRVDALARERAPDERADLPQNPAEVPDVPLRVLARPVVVARHDLLPELAEDGGVAFG